MKKVLLYTFLLFSLFSSADIKIPSNMTHVHTHTSDIGVEHVHEHSHVEVSNTLFIEKINFKEVISSKTLKVENKDNLNSKLIINSIFRPPIA